MRQTGLERQQAVQENLAKQACYRETINAHLVAVYHNFDWNGPAEMGSDLNHIVKTTTYITDPRYREPVYQEIGKWLEGVFPNSER